MAVHLRAASSFRGTHFRSAMTQQPRVGSRGIARALEGCGREALGAVGGHPGYPRGRPPPHWRTLKVIRLGFSKDA